MHNLRKCSAFWKLVTSSTRTFISTGCKQHGIALSTAPQRQVRHSALHPLRRRGYSLLFSTSSVGPSRHHHFPRPGAALPPPCARLAQRFLVLPHVPRQFAD